MRHLVASLALALTLLPGLASADAQTERLALDHLDRLAEAGEFAFPEALSFQPRQTLEWAGGTRVRVTQELLGLPVHGRELVISLDDDGIVTRVSGQPVDGVLLDVHPALDAEGAEARAQGLVYAVFGGTGTIYPPRSEQVVFVDRDEVPHLAWKAYVSIGDPLGNYEVIFDAVVGKVLDLQPTLVHAQGYVYPTNPVTSDQEEVEILRLSETIDGMQGEYAYVNSCTEGDFGWGGDGCTEKEKFAMPDQGGDYYFDADPGSYEDPFAEVMMYWHLDLISAWFDENFGFAHAQPIEGLVNFDYNNAAYGNFDSDPAAEVGFGQAGIYDLAYDADVIYHEFGHSVFGSVAGQTGFLGFDEYGMEWATGGINEGTADSFSMVLTGDPQVGDYAGRAFGYNGPIRDLDADRHCPTDLYGQSHQDGEVLGALVWNVIEEELLGAEFAGEFFWGAVSALPVNANWMDLSETLVASADELLAEGLMEQAAHDRLIELLVEAGLDACGRVIRLDEEQEPTFLLLTMRFVGDHPVPAGNQFSLDAPEGTYRLRFRVKDWISQEPNLAYEVFVRRGEYVHHDPEEIPTQWGSIDMPFPIDYDFSVEGDDDEFEIELTLDSDPPLEPGATYYFSIATRTLGDFDYGWVAAEVTVDGDTWWEEPEVPADDDDDEGAGCQDCSSSLGGGQATAGLLVLALVGLLRRR